jgi:hypothetical protein
MNPSIRFNKGPSVSNIQPTTRNEAQQSQREPGQGAMQRSVIARRKAAEYIKKCEKSPHWQAYPKANYPQEEVKR